MSLLSAGVLIFIFAFIAGLWFEEKKPWPHAPVYEALSSIVRALKQGAWLPKNVLVDPEASTRRRDFVVEPGATATPGYRAVMGYLAELEGYGIRLYDERGRIRHRWPLNYAAIDADGPSNGNDAPHAMLLLRDGSVIVNFDHGDAMARFDACGRVLWKRDGHFHHAFGPADDGSVWTWRGETSSEDQYQYLVRFDPRTGRTIEEIGLVEEMLRTPAARTAFAVASAHRFEHATVDASVDDLFHPNDVEVLTRALTPAFPQFRAGDLLLSFRNNNLVAVLDPRSRTLRWAAHGPWVRQHDPDFLPDGRIAVYNNNTGRDASNILIVDPRTDAVTEAPRGTTSRFYAGAMGKHEQLADGRRLIVNPMNGRVEELAPDGRLLLTIHNRYSDRFNAYVADAAWLPASFFTAAPWTRCGVEGDRR